MSEVFLEGRATAVGNIYCIGRNYAAHIEELKNETPAEPVVFMKPDGSLLHSGGKIRLPDFSSDVHFECELVLLIGRDCDGLTAGADWKTLIAGYAVGLDLTARDVQGRLKSKGLPWLKAKGFKGSACVSDFAAAEKLPHPEACTFSLSVNGTLRQRGDTSLMIHPLPEILAELSSVYGLRAGDLVFTGTPAGVGRLVSGDRLSLELAGLVRADFEVA